MNYYIDYVKSLGYDEIGANAIVESAEACASIDGTSLMSAISMIVDICEKQKKNMSVSS